MLRCFSTGSAGRTGSRTGSPSRASPTTTGKVERFHQTLRRELLDGCGAFESIEAAQAALDAWVQEYNSVRPHQALDMQSPADRFTPVPEQERACWRCGCPGCSRWCRSSGQPLFRTTELSVACAMVRA